MSLYLPTEPNIVLSITRAAAAPSPASGPPSAAGGGTGGAREPVGSGKSPVAPGLTHQPRLTLMPIGLTAARLFVAELHRHHPHTQRGHKFSVAVEDETGKRRGVAIAGRPVARMLDNGQRLEALRVCTDGCRNACSALYGAVRRAGMGMGYRPENIFTYILWSESGASLLAAGWVPMHRSKAEGWDRPSRSRTQRTPVEPKVRWHAA